MSNQRVKIKPCPFCGSDDIQISNYGHRTACQQDIICMACTGSVSGDVTIQSVNSIEIWNSRPLEDKLQTQLHNLKMDVDVLIGIFWDYTNGHVQYEELLNHIRMLEKHIGE